MPSISKKTTKFLEQGSWIRTMFEQGIALKNQFGEKNIYDLSFDPSADQNQIPTYSNPSTDSFIDNWIRMVATNRLTGHSAGFFSGYTLPPNQAASQKSQKVINERLGLSPPYKNTKEIILKKSKSLL